MTAGTLNPVALMNIRHLIVDEYQDLNPMDLAFVDHFAANGVTLFVAGDDDQSIYSFRYASPGGIQRFATKYATCGRHSLSGCFRCTPNVLITSQRLIGANQGPNRIAKYHVSLYRTSNPPVQGVVHLWRFSSGISEARHIAESCRELINAQIQPRDILILLSKCPTLLPTLAAQLQTAGVPFEPPRAEGFLDSETGRLVLSLSRIVCQPDDYIAHRTLLGLLPRVGVATCHSICNSIIINNMNYRNIFYHALPAGVFRGRAITALNRARGICALLSAWQPNDTIAQRSTDISGIIGNLYGAQEVLEWQNYSLTFPQDTTLEELRNLLWADTDEQQALLLQAIYDRLNIPVPAVGLLPAKVRIMTMHGAKGLSGRIVFIPGLEGEILPGPKRRPFPGLVLEAARMLYVSITRARAACILSYANTRIVNGNFNNQTPSQFCPQLGGPFINRTNGLTPNEIHDIIQTCALL